MARKDFHIYTNDPDVISNKVISKDLSFPLIKALRKNEPE